MGIDLSSWRQLLIMQQYVPDLMGEEERVALGLYLLEMPSIATVSMGDSQAPFLLLKMLSREGQDRAYLQMLLFCAETLLSMLPFPGEMNKEVHALLVRCRDACNDPAQLGEVFQSFDKDPGLFEYAMSGADDDWVGKLDPAERKSHPCYFPYGYAYDLFILAQNLVEQLVNGNGFQGLYYRMFHGSPVLLRFRNFVVCQLREENTCAIP